MMSETASVEKVFHWTKFLTFENFFDEMLRESLKNRLT